MKTFPKALAMNSFLVHFAAAFQMLAPGPQTFCRKHKMLEMRLKGLESCFSPYPRPASCKAFRKSTGKRRGAQTGQPGAETRRVDAEGGRRHKEVGASVGRKRRGTKRGRGGKEGAGEERGRGTGWKGKKREEWRVWPHLQETGLNRSHFPR